MTSYQPLSTSPWSSGVNIQEAQDYLLTINGTTAHTAAGITASVDVIEANGTPASAKTFVLTTSADTFTGGNGHDQFNGVAGQIDNDTFNGGRGTDTLTFTVAAGDSNSSFTSTFIENIQIRATGVATIDFGDVTGTTSLEVNRTTSNLTLENLNEIDPITLDRVDDNANVIFTYKSAVVEGVSDSVTITIDNSSDSGIVRVDGIETVNLVSTNSPQYDRDDATENGNELVLDNAGSLTATEVVNISGAGSTTITATDALTINNSASGESDVTGTAATTYTHTGSGVMRVTVGVADTTTTASGTGALIYTEAALQAGNTTVTGSSGDDTFNMVGNLDTDDIITGGTGADTLVVTGDSIISAAAGDITVSGVETLEIDTDGTVTIDFDWFANPAELTTIFIDGAGDAHEATLTDVQASTYTIENGNTATTHDLDFVVIDLKDSSGSADAITINLDNNQAGTGALTEDFLINTGLTANGVETITINTTTTHTDADTTAAEIANLAEDFTITALNSDAVSTLTLTGAGDVTITNALDTGLDTLNASASTGDNTFTVSGGAQTITGGTGADTVNFGTSYTTADSFDGGAGTDVMAATWASGNNTPTGISNVEILSSTFTGGSLDATNLGSVTTHRIIDQTANTTISNLASTATTINQRGDGATARANTFSYATGAAATVTFNNDDATEVLANASTTFSNVANLTVAANDGSAANAFTWDLASLAGGTALNTLTLTTGSDADDTLDTGAITAANLETWTITADDANITVDTFAGAGELKTLTINNTNTSSLGHVAVGAIGATTAADELTAFTVTTLGTSNDGGSSQVTVTSLDAAGATMTMNMNLAGDYGTSTVGTVTAETVSSLDLTTGTLGTALNVDNFVLTGNMGNVTINVGDAFDGDDDFIDTKASGTVGDIALTTSALALNIAEGAGENFVTDAITVGNVTLSATAAAASINIGGFEDTTTIGNITFTGTGSITADGAAAATSVGNISGSVAVSETVDLTNEDAAHCIGAASGTVGTTTVTGAGTFNMVIGAVTSLGNIDLSGMDASTSASTITLNNGTTVGITYTGSSGGDTFVSTGGADTITGGLGADTITGNDGADTIDLTESTAAADTVILTDNDNVDTITGFTTTGADDIISIDVSAIETEISGNLVDSSGDAAASDAIIIHTITEGDDDGATAIAAQANIIYFDDTDNNDLPGTSTDWEFTLDADTGAAVDGILAIHYDADGGFANLGYLTDAGSNTDATFTAGTAVFTSLAHINMSSTVYGELAAANFAIS